MILYVLRRLWAKFNKDPASIRYPNEPWSENRIYNGPLNNKKPERHTQ